MSSEFEYFKEKEINNKRLVLSFVNNDSPIKRKFGKKAFRFFFKITFFTVKVKIVSELLRSAGLI